MLGLGALEYALLAPAACVVAIQLLADGRLEAVARADAALGDRRAARLRRWRSGRSRSARRSPAAGGAISQALDSIHVLKCLFVQPKHLIGPLGTAVYWFGDIVCLWACLQAFTHGTPDISLLLLGYATGYALTRRTLPFGGAGAVDALLPFALSWCGISLAAAVARGLRLSRLQLLAADRACGTRHALAMRAAVAIYDGKRDAARRRASSR